MFVKRKKVSVSIDGGINVIWIRPQMGVEVYNQVQDALLGTAAISTVTGESVGVKLTPNQQKTVLLQHNILDWHGPDFVDEDGNPVLFSASAVADLDPNTPLLEAALEEIGKRNLKAVTADPNSSSVRGKNGSTLTTAQEKQGAKART